MPVVGPCAVIWTVWASSRGASVLSCRAMGIWDLYFLPSAVFPLREPFGSMVAVFTFRR